MRTSCVQIRPDARRWPRAVGRPFLAAAAFQAAGRAGKARPHSRKPSLSARKHIMGQNRVFITFGGAQRHVDSQDWLPHVLLYTALISPLCAADLQRAMDRAMSGRAGTAVALDVDSGRILARYRIDVAARRLARPGSTVKPFTLLALLASGSTPRTLVCARKLQIGARAMDC